MSAEQTLQLNFILGQNQTSLLCFVPLGTKYWHTNTLKTKDITSQNVSLNNQYLKIKADS